METIAVYWEQVIRVYGIDSRTGISLVVARFPGSQFGTVTDHLTSSTPALDKFIFCNTTGDCDDHFDLVLAISAGNSGAVVEHLKILRKSIPEFTLDLHQPVDLVFFHGPHFQDRYGIAEAVYSCLDNNLNLLATGCTGTSVYIVVGPGQSGLVKQYLAERFSGPGISKDDRV